MEDEAKIIDREVFTYILSKSDFKSALSASRLLMQYANKNNLTDQNFYKDVVYKALHCAAVVSYAKPYGRNKPNISLCFDKIKEYVSDEEIELHHSLLKLRNTCLAHSDLEARRVTIYPPGTYKNNDGFHFEIRNKAFSPSKIQEIINFIEKLLKIIDKLYMGKIELSHSKKGSPSDPYQIDLESLR